MDNSLSKVNHISQLATKFVDEKNMDLLKKQKNEDLEIVADQFESIFVFPIVFSQLKKI